MNALIQRYLSVPTAVKIAEGFERALRDGALAGGERIPTVRGLAATLRVSPATVASAYARLRGRGIALSDGRRGTRLSHRPLHAAAPRPRPAAPARTRSPATRALDDGTPDPALLPDLSRSLRRIDGAPRLYGAAPHHEPLLRLLKREFIATGVAAGELCVTSGAMEAIERVLAVHLRPGDRVAVEDPGFTGHLDLVMALGLVIVPVAIDGEGPLPDSLGRACRAGAAALIVTPRAQSPTGAAISERRAADLRRVLRQRPDMLVIEDDHANRISGAPLCCLHDRRRARWVHVHSFSKSLNPDLRLAVMAGDDTTIARVRDRMVVAERWVSHVLQRLAADVLGDGSQRRRIERAASTYRRRREALLEALCGAGFDACGVSGYNVWVPVAEETATVQALAACGWAVAAGERFRIASPTSIRITAATLEPADARRLTASLAVATSVDTRTKSA